MVPLAVVVLDVLPRAALWECWDRGRESLESFTIITTAAFPGLADIHRGQPVIVDPDRVADWLDPSSPMLRLFELLRERHEDASRLPRCRRRARQAVVLEGIGAAFEQGGRVLAQLRVGIRPRPAEAQRVRQASSPREHSRPLRTPPSGELIRRRIRREAYRSRRAVRQQQRRDAPTRTIVCTEPPSSGRLADTGWLSSNARCTHAATGRPGAVARHDPTWSTLG